MYKKTILIIIFIILCWLLWLKYNMIGRKYLKTYTNYKKNNNINIISYNIGLLPFNIKNFDILEKIIINYDIILLQEFFTNLFFSKKNWLLNFCKKHKYNIVTKEDIRLSSGKLVDGGLVIMSKYPITKVSQTCFKSYAFSFDKLANKGFLHAVIKINNKELSLYNLHNQSFYTKFKNPYFIQNYQLKKLNNFIDKKDKYIIIGGDFNIESKYSTNIIKSMKAFDSKNATIYIKYDKSNNELYSTSEEEEGLTSYNLDYYLAKNIDLQVKSYSNNFSDHKYITSTIIFKK